MFKTPEQKVFRKLSHDGGRNWRGYLMPTEILLLAGIGGADFNQQDIKEAKEAKAKGDSSCRWTYFSVRNNSKIESLLIGR